MGCRDLRRRELCGVFRRVGQTPIRRTRDCRPRRKAPCQKMAFEIRSMDSRARRMQKVKGNTTEILCPTSASSLCMMTGRPLFHFRRHRDPSVITARSTAYFSSKACFKALSTPLFAYVPVGRQLGNWTVFIVGVTSPLHQRRWTGDLCSPSGLPRSGFTVTAVTFNLRYLLLNCREPGACLLVRQMQNPRCGRACARRLRR